MRENDLWASISFQENKHPKKEKKTGRTLRIEDGCFFKVNTG